MQKVSITCRGPRSAREKTARSPKLTGSGWAAACVPLFALAGFGLVSFVQHHRQARAGAVPWGQLTRIDAQATARQGLAPLLGVAPNTLTVSDAWAHKGTLLKKEKMAPASGVRSWQVVVRAADGQYLVRMNADTGRLYGFNRLDSEPHQGADVDAAPARTGGGEGALLSRSEGELRARQCLRHLGVPLGNLKRVSVQASDSLADAPVSQWNFAYRRLVPGFGVRTVIVCINRQTGAPNTFWNPTGAFMAL